MPTSDSLFFRDLLSSVAEYKASGLHLSVGNQPLLRIEGLLRPVAGHDTVTPEFMNKFLHFCLEIEQKKRFEQNRDLILSWNFEDRMRFRLHFFYQDDFPAVILSYIPDRIRDFQELGLPDAVLSFSELKQGLVIFNGPKMSGKTTTIASLIEHINQNQARHIITLEHPIEYLFRDAQSVIDQREVGRDASSFEQGLREFIREDIDVFYVSQIRNRESIQEVLHLTSAGHLVFAVMDTSSTYAALQGMVDMFPPSDTVAFRHQLADNLAGVVTQKLVLAVGGGLALASELWLPTSAGTSVLRVGDLYQIQHILQTSRGEGMISLDRSLAFLATRGVISEETAFENALDKNTLRMMLR